MAPDHPPGLVVGDCRDGLREFAAAGLRAQVCVTSPPYWGLRDYGTGTWDGGLEACDHREVPPQNRPGRETPGGRGGTFPTSERAYRDTCGKCGARRIDQQIGLEPTPELYVAHLVDVFRLVRDVMADDGTLWLNLGDSYAGGGPHHGENNIGITGTNNLGSKTGLDRLHIPGLKPKDLVGIPWRAAFALQADGWYLRSDIIWAKANPMPESVTDRPTKAHEYVFLLSKQERYYYDAAAIAERATQGERFHGAYGKPGILHLTAERNGRHDLDNTIVTRNRRSVWSIATQPYPEAHFATFPEDLVKPCILAGTSAYGCCPRCGRQWEQIVERRGYTAETLTPKTTAKIEKGYLHGRPGTHEPGWRTQPPPEVKTLGWRPGCACGLEPVPAVVLDPFLGSGTVAQVAQDLGRAWIGCELNPPMPR